MKKTENYAMPYPEQDDYFNVKDFQDMMVSVDNLMKKISDSGSQISSDAEHLYNQTKAQMDNIQKRMNTFTSLKDGSTTGDAELEDIRVAYDGKEYGNAGEAVREQASDIHKALFGAGASIWSKAKSESTKYVAETKGICILNERFTAAGVVTKISRGIFAENESTLNLDRECSAYIVEFEKNPGTVYMPSAETVKIVSTTKIIFEANGNARCWIPVEKGQYLAVDSTATAYTSESNHVPYMLYDQANKTLECRGFGSTGSIEPVDPYSLALEYKLEYDMDDTGLVKQIDANREAAASLKEDIEEINIIPIKNCVEKIDAWHYWDNAGYLVENIDYDAVTIKVNAGKKYSVNKLIGDNNFNLVIGKDGNIIEKFTSDMCKPIGNGYYFTAPNNADYLKLSSGVTTYFNTLIIVEGVKDISNYDISKYPIGIPVKIKSNLPFQTMNGLDVDEVGKYLSLFNDCQSVNLIDTFTNVINQYFDGNDFTVKDGYRYYKRNVNANETYKVTALTDGEVPFTFYLLDFNGDVLRKETDCKDTIIFIEQDGIMIINSSWKYSLDPVVNLMTYDGSKQIIAPRIFYCGKNRQFKKLKDCIEEATKYMDAVVYVDDGIYDLISEFGVDYLDSYNGTDNIGIELKNRVHIIFSSGATVVFNYTGTNEATQKYFSPFNAGAYGYTLENAWVESVNCRYSVHDERANADDSYHNVYKRCVFIHDSSKASGWHASQAIGGGLGKYGDILIEDCYCKSVGNDDSISYHSPNVSEEGNNSKSKIVVKNTYTSGTLCFIPLGNSSRKTPIYVTGCNTRIAPYLNGSAETMELTQWGNTIRES